MTIYVDKLHDYPTKHWRWCHMMTDTDLTELHEMAFNLGLKREWFRADNHRPHYDLVENKRERALHLGALAVSSKDMLRRCARQIRRGWKT